MFDELARKQPDAPSRVVMDLDANCGWLVGQTGVAEAYDPGAAGCGHELGDQSCSQLERSFSTECWALSGKAAAADVPAEPV